MLPLSSCYFIENADTKRRREKNKKDSQEYITEWIWQNKFRKNKKNYKNKKVVLIK